jgi:HD-GYP domain-containing protein (c-di-GMP phosphodiesterase class II)
LYNSHGIWISPAADEKEAEKLERPPVPAHLRLVSAESEQDIARYISIPVELLPLDIPLPYGVYVRIGQKFVKFRNSGDLLTTERAQALVRGRVDCVFIGRNEWDQMLQSMEHFLGEAERSAQLTLQQHGENVRSLLIGYQRDMEVHKNLERNLLDRFRTLADRLSQLVLDHPEVANQLIRRYQDTNLYFVNHTINVAIYSVSIGKKRQLPKSTLRLLALAALMHNVGNIFVPRDLLYKGGELTVREKLLVDAHVIHGAKLLTRLSAPPEVIYTAQQHHDRIDGKNRPGGTTGPLHLFARIVSIADVFDALTSPRPHQPVGLTPMQALERMRGMEGKFDPAILNAVGDSAPPKK